METKDSDYINKKYGILSVLEWRSHLIWDEFYEE